MREAPEYWLAKSLIAHLKAIPELEACVFPEPWSKEDQVDAIAMAAAAQDFAVAVMPQPLRMLPNETKTTGGVQAVVAVAVISTAQIHAPARLAALVSFVISHLLDWWPQSAGIPYADADLLSISPLLLSDYKQFQNMAGTVMEIGKTVNLKTYHKNHA